MQTADLVSTAFNKVLELPANLASSYVARPRVAAKLTAGFEHARKAHEPRLPDLRPQDRTIVADLERTGVHVTSLDALGIPGSDTLLGQGRALYERFCGQGRPGHSLLPRSLQAGAAEVMANRETFLWGLDDRLLDIAESYLGVPVGFDGINIFFTKADGRQVAARRWHRDAEDRRMVKIAVYMNDVDDHGGPLQVLRRRMPDHDRTVRGKFPILKQADLEAQLPDFDAERDIVTCVGRAGTVVFADTALHFHRGKPATARDRCAVYFNYIHETPLRPFRCERSTISRAQIAELAAALPERQRASLLWRTRLPLGARLVPPAPVWE